ncbi:MAG TPA: beta-1-3, beta-1-6-glucan biosynthesis protein [Xanthobacteraceae bacterium]|nr:beta-1-3, beta-1-6-glucan biosynthesis protein [Xanthobacteraceae bacterium]
MLHRVLSVAGVLCAALFIIAAPLAPLTQTAHAQGADTKAADKKPAPGQQPAQKEDEYSEISHQVAGPAGNPECVWLGRRVVSLLWRDDLDTAFRHLDLYDRFGCPAGHVQAAFRCLILHASNIDPKAPDSLNGRVEACWINPTQPAPPPPAASAATPAPSSGH